MKTGIEIPRFHRRTLALLLGRPNYGPSCAKEKGNEGHDNDKDSIVREPLQIWFDNWRAEYDSSTLYFKNAASEQIMFVRDVLAPLFWAGVPYSELASEGEPRGDCKITGFVIGEHRSKSVRLPVYLLERTDLGLQFVMRGNFHDWKLSVTSERPIESDLFPYLFHTTPPIDPEYTGNELASVYFEGFPEDRIFGYHYDNHRRWSACLNQRNLWTVIFLCMHSAGAIRPLAEI
jgi:hypothetical protein